MKTNEIEIEKEHHFFRTLFFLIILFIILLFLYGKFLGTSGLIVKDYDIKNDNIPESFDGFKIAHFSDILYDGMNDEVFDEIIEKINDKKVDIIIFSGNLTKKRYKVDNKKYDFIVSKLKELNSNYGKYYISGIDDKKDPSYDTIMLNSGFISLNDNKDIIYSKNKESILLVGLDNNTSNAFLTDLLKENVPNYKIITFSESDEFDEIKDYNFDLALSSNSLNGLINIPVIKEYFTREGSKQYIDPYYKNNSTDFYISSGIGTDMIDFRLFNKPSINIYNLVK